jgi:hypothetical protein
MLLTVQIPVLPHVLKYIHKKHGGHFKLSRRHNEGKMLYHMLRNQQDIKRFDLAREKYTAQLDVLVTVDAYKERACCTISSTTIYDFNNFIDSIIKDEFIHYVETLRQVQVQLTVDQMVDGFMGKYNFDDGDITPFVLKQTYFRFKRAERQKIADIRSFSAAVVTNKPTSRIA